MKLNSVNKRGDLITHCLIHAPALPAAAETYSARFKGMKVVRGKVVCQWSIFKSQSTRKGKAK